MRVASEFPLATRTSLLAIPTAGRLFDVFDALRLGATSEQIFEATKFDPWFIQQFIELIETEREMGRTPQHPARAVAAPR